MSPAVGVTTFAALVWGAVLLVAAVFGYVAWSLLADRRTDRTPPTGAK